MAKKKIAVAYDGSKGAWKALQEAIRLAKLEKTYLRVVSVEELPRYSDLTSEVIEEKESDNHYMHKIQKKAVELARRERVSLRMDVLVGHPARSIVDYLKKEKVDLLVLGHSGHSSVWGLFLGTTADKVVRHAPCSVLVVR